MNCFRVAVSLQCWKFSESYTQRPVRSARYGRLKMATLSGTGSLPRVTR